MDRILLGIEGVNFFNDDIIMDGKDVEQCKERLSVVLERLNVHNVRIKQEKCKFLDSQVKCLGHVLSNKTYPLTHFKELLCEILRYRRRFVIYYNSTPSATGKSPSSIFFRIS